MSPAQQDMSAMGVIESGHCFKIVVSCCPWHSSKHTSTSGNNLDVPVKALLPALAHEGAALAQAWKGW